MLTTNNSTYCPNAQPDMPGAVIYGLISAESGKLGYLAKPYPITTELLESVAPISPKEIFRFSADCALEKCRHHVGSHCGLIESLIQISLPKKRGIWPPNCSVRKNCRWFAEHDSKACVCCAQTLSSGYEARPNDLEA